MVVNMARAAGLELANRAGMRFSRILCAIDFTPSSRQALTMAIELAQRGGRLDLCHVFERERLVAEVGGLPDGARLLDELTVRAGEELEEWRKLTAASLPAVETHSLGGRRAWDSLTSFARDFAPDLIVVGGGARRHGWLGSTAERIVRHAPCSVLVVAGEARPPKRILCAVDFSEPAREAVAAAAALIGEQGGGTLTLVHAFSVAELVGMGWAPGSFDQAQRAAANCLGDWARTAERSAGRSAVTQVIDGVPGEAILATARAADQDLIVTGTHGRTGIRRALLGSIAEHIVRHADRPVLVVRATPATP